MISALFVRENSIYKSLNVDCWDIKRDATKWNQNNSIIAHPPCRAWGQLSHFAKPREGEKELSLFAIDKIRKFGGILEHPRSSKLWPGYLPYPGKNKFDEFGGYSILINQSWFGHKALKKTLLYIVGCNINDLPDIPLSFNAIEYTIGGCTRTKIYRKKEVTKSEREATPVKLAKWLIETAEKCNKRNVI